MDAQILCSQIFCKKSGFLKILEKVPKIGQKSCFSCFSQNLVYRLSFLLKLKQLHTVHNFVKLHIWEKSGSQIMAQNCIIQSDFSNMNISRLAGRIELIFFME